MPHLGFWELLVVLAVVMLIFGAGKLPEIGDELGRRMRGAGTPRKRVTRGSLFSAWRRFSRSDSAGG